MKKYFLAVFIILSGCKKNTVTDVTPIDAKGEILFISRRISNTADWQMFVMNADGSNQKNLSNNIVRCAPPVLSHSGKKVAFTTYDKNFYYNLYIINTDGQHQVLLASGKEFCGTPVWSPDDNNIAFVKNNQSSGGNNEIYTIRVDGSNEIKLTNQDNNFSPQFSPDNRSIIYTSSNNNGTGIYKMNRDGSNKQLLTPPDKSFGDPVVSPDGKLIAITSYDAKGSQIFVMHNDGSNLKQLTFTASPRSFPGWPVDGNYNPVWSPNSSQLVYVSFENGSPDIFLIQSNGAGNKRLTDTPMRDENPCWTKDGNFILFSSNRNTKLSSEIYIMKTDGQLQTPLTNYIADDIYPAFINK